MEDSISFLQDYYSTDVLIYNLHFPLPVFGNGHYLFIIVDFPLRCYTHSEIRLQPPKCHPTAYFQPYHMTPTVERGGFAHFDQSAEHVLHVERGDSGTPAIFRQIRSKAMEFLQVFKLGLPKSSVERLTIQEQDG
jgi:hypothetical protein